MPWEWRAAWSRFHVWDLLCLLGGAGSEGFKSCPWVQRGRTEIRREAFAAVLIFLDSILDESDWWAAPWRSRGHPGDPTGRESGLSATPPPEICVNDFGAAPRRAARGPFPLPSAGRFVLSLCLLIRDDSSQQSSRTPAAGSRLAAREENLSAAVGPHYASLAASRKSQGNT
ncbi:hypothetical protein AOQ84DRAFT_367243 [Glonium stellatum]|uniref:Uncharacterized protein n=1 Tax=Glonium stellatum TaxID=574774 RepID=A0A8E2ETS9_9PEZI|nr:hypothetical protein AOQ84DRAFT_367243 [Glonium stellatum]